MAMSSSAAATRSILLGSAMILTPAPITVSTWPAMLRASLRWPHSSRARLLLQSALEAEVTEFLCRNRYERRKLASDARNGSRNG
jgi:hypothetical protein